MLRPLLSLLLLVPVCFAWPDGAPCVHAAYESMNPLEAVEHQGGLQLSPPPYEIKLDQKCYWRNQPIALTLQGLNESIWFKGFVIQPLRWENDRLGERIGQLVRLDDNGSWQQQCFRFKDSATHSHDEKKKHMKMWWKVDDESATVQFVATVVKHQTMFWVRSVYSVPIPPCRLNRFGIQNYVPPQPAMPPTVKQFKMESSKMFGNGAITQRTFETTTPMPRPLPVVTSPPQTAAPTLAPVTNAPNIFQQRRPESSSPRLHQIIPLPTMEVVHRHGFQPLPTVAQPMFIVQTTPTPVFRPIVPQPQPQFQAPIQRQQFQFVQQRQQLQICSDRDALSRCFSWRPFCRSPQFFPYMSTFCRRTCGFC